MQTRFVSDIPRSIVWPKELLVKSVLLILSAPIIKDVEITYNQVQFNGSLLVSNAYRLDAGPEVDAAWKELGVDCKLSQCTEIPVSNVHG